MLARGLPIAAGINVLTAGSPQFTAWKAGHLACCWGALGRGRTLPAEPVRSGDTACASASTAATPVPV
jgi:hypothetical protein